MSKHAVIVLTGNTYALRDEIRTIPGARWDAGRKAWIIEPGNMSERAIQSSKVYALKKRGVTVTEQ